MQTNQIESRRNKYLKDEFSKEYFVDLKQRLSQEINKGLIIYPSQEDIFRALELTIFNKVKVVILGQDPYHGPGQAHGLSFSVPDGVKIPPSLRNIFVELESDLGIKASPSGDLSRWAEQGVLLLNAFLTVRAGQAGSHHDIGWQTFTDKIIEIISENKENIVFVLRGNFAQSKESLIDKSKHLIIKSPHPSPFSARRGFFGSKPFSKINKYLSSKSIDIVDWRL